MASATQSRMCLDKRSARGGPQWRVGASSPRWAKLLHGRQANQITKQLIIKVIVEVRVNGPTPTIDINGLRENGIWGGICLSVTKGPYEWQVFGDIAIAIALSVAQ